MKRCLYCFEDIYQGTSLPAYFQKKDIICGCCRSKMPLFKHWIRVEDLAVYGLYYYDEFMEGMLFQFKECRDIALKNVFLRPYIKEIFDTFHGYTLILMPSSDTKNKERGFYALEEMFEEVNLPKLEIFQKNRTYKQTKQSYEKRKDISKVMILKENVELPNTPVLLVDDVCTSGSTLLSAYHLLKNHPYEIKAFVCCVHPLLVESCDKL